MRSPVWTLLEDKWLREHDFIYDQELLDETLDVFERNYL